MMRAVTPFVLTTTDSFGANVILNLPAGAYNVEVRYLGYRAETREVTVGTEEEPAAANLGLVAIPLKRAAIEVTAAGPLVVATRTGSQTVKQREHAGGRSDSDGLGVHA